MVIRIYADANALIRGVEGADRAAALVRRVLASDGGAVVSSELTSAEVLVGPMKLLRTDPADPRGKTWRAGYEALFDIAGALQATPVTGLILRQAAELRARHGSLKLPDAIHLATAVAARCEFMLSDDRKLLRACAPPLRPTPLDPADLDALLARVEAS